MIQKYVIGDIHGCSRTFKELINRIGPSLYDEIYLLGDCINKGPDSAGVLDFIFELETQGFKISSVRGNHEQNLIDAYYKFPPQFFQKYVGKVNKSANLLDENGQLIRKYFNYMYQLPYFLEVENFWLVHAGFNFRNHNIFEDKIAMLEIRSLSEKIDVSKLNGKRIIHGHEPTKLKTLNKAIENNSPSIPLDNGCVYKKVNKDSENKKWGNLCCYNISTNELIKQKNVEL